MKLEKLLKETKQALARLNRFEGRSASLPLDLLSFLSLTQSCMEEMAARPSRKQARFLRSPKAASKRDTMPSPPSFLGTAPFRELSVFEQAKFLLIEAGVRPNNIAPFLDWWQHGRGGKHAHIFEYQAPNFGNLAEGMYCSNCVQFWDGKGEYPAGPCIVVNEDD